MDAREFFRQFNQLFLEGNRSYEDALVCYKDPTIYTAFITHHIRNILQCTNDEAITEYYRIDVALWKQRYDDISAPKPKSFERCMWDLQVAVEHENNESKWMDEVIKLAHICCPLRIVIVYLPMRKSVDHMTYLNYVAEALANLEVVYNLKRGEFLVIIGNCGTKKQAPKDYLGYTPYLYNVESKKFELQSDWLLVK